MGRITLRQITVNNEIFNKILESFTYYIEIKGDLRPYYSGYRDKNIIYYNGEDYLICTESILNFVYPLEEYTDWKQVIVRKMATQEVSIQQDVTGTYAYNYMMKILSRSYSKEEILSILQTYSDSYDYNRKQFHEIGWDNKYYVKEWENCYEFDINGAHTDALCEIFPKAKNDIISVHNRRKKDPRIKKFFNYFVGMLKHKGFDGVYNHIVQRTTKKLLAAIEFVDGYMIYANTDGFVVQSPHQVLDTSKDLGDFKLEYQGTVYTYRDKNYWAIQTSELKGNILSEARKGVDLSKGIIVKYDKVKNEFGGFIAKNIRLENINETCNKNVNR